MYMEQNTFQPIKLASIVSLLQLGQDILLYPLDTIATRIKSYNTKHVTMTREIQKIIRNEGIYSFYRGISTSIPTIFVPSMAYFLTYENLNYMGKSYL